jgi:hypothetical protein
MTAEFTSINIEIYNGAWVNVTADVRTNPSPKWNRGIMSNKPEERVGHPGYFSFTLDNSEANSAGLNGYYSPGHANCWAGWTTGLKVRLSFTSGGYTYYKYYGRIKPDGIEVIPGIYGERSVNIVCGDWMWLAAQHELKTLTFAQNKNINELVDLVNANMPFLPLATHYHTPVETFPTVFDMAGTKTTALSEYYKAAMSEWGYIYVTGDLTNGETLVVECQDTRPGAGVATSFSRLEPGMQVGYGKTLTNRVNSTAYPRRVDVAATTVLYELQKSFEVKAGETITGFRGRYRDPNNLASRISGIDMQPLVSGTDFTATLNENGSGGSEVAHLTITPAFGTEAVIYQLTNTAAHSIWVQTLRAVGKGVYTYDVIQSVQDDTLSQATHGVIPLSLDFKYQADARKVQSFCGYVLSKESSPKTSIENCQINVNSTSDSLNDFLSFGLGTRAAFSESLSGISDTFFIQGYSAEIIEGKYVLWNPILKSDPGFYDFARWGEDVWDTAIWA